MELRSLTLCWADLMDGLERCDLCGGRSESRFTS